MGDPIPASSARNNTAATASTREEHRKAQASTSKELMIAGTVELSCGILAMGSAEVNGKLEFSERLLATRLLNIRVIFHPHNSDAYLVDRVMLITGGIISILGALTLVKAVLKKQEEERARSSQL